MYYGSPFYIASIGFLLLITSILYFLLKKRSKKLQQHALLAIMLLNLMQHILKPLIYPQFIGTGFSAIMTAYNMCSLLILISPFILLWGNRFWRNFLFFTGAAAGFGAIAFPYWYMGLTISQLGSDYIRFYLCHALLFISSLLPLLLNFHRPNYSEFWQIGIGFLLALCAVFFNNVIFICSGLFPNASPETMYQDLRKLNTCWIMGPPDNLPWIRSIAQSLSPDIFLGKNPSGNYTPILWYAIPLYCGLTLGSLCVFSIIDHRKVCQDLKFLRHKFSKK